MLRPAIRRIDDINELWNAGAYKSLRKSLEKVKDGRRLDSEEVKCVFNLAGTCMADVHCLYYSPKKKFQGYVLFRVIPDSGIEARDFLEEMIGKEIKERFGEPAFKEYCAHHYEGFSSKIKWIKHSDKTLGINMNYSSKTLTASYTSFITEFSEAEREVLFGETTHTK